MTVVVNDLSPFGAQRVAIQVVSGLIRSGVGVDLVSLEAPGQPQLRVPDGVTWTHLDRPPRRKLSPLTIVWRLRRTFIRTRPDVVIAHMVFANWTTLLAIATLRRTIKPAVIITEHSLTSNVLLERSGRLVMRLAKMTYRRADALVGVSDAVRDDAVRVFNVAPDRATTIYNPIDVEAIRAQSRGPVPHPWLEADPLRPTTLVAVGRLVPVKDYGTVIRAAAIFTRSRLLIVGDGPELETLRALSANLGASERISFCGYVSNPMPYIRHADALVSSSLWEGFGLTVLEAAALGTPALVPDVPALDELVPRFASGYRYTSRDPLSLAAAIERVSGMCGEPADLSPFAPDVVARKYLTLATDVLRVHHNRRASHAQGLHSSVAVYRRNGGIDEAPVQGE